MTVYGIDHDPLKEIGEFLIAAGEKEYFFRPSFINMTRIGEPKDIVLLSMTFIMMKYQILSGRPSMPMDWS
jgi:hypothetical protein